jgi:hypothetical protein
VHCSVELHAAAAYEQALIIRQELEQTFLLMETRAGLAQVALAQGKLGQANVFGGYSSPSRSFSSLQTLVFIPTNKIGDLA